MNNNTPPVKSFSLPTFPVKKDVKNSNSPKKVFKDLGNAVLKNLTKKNLEKSSLDNHLFNNHKVEQGMNQVRKKSSLVNGSLNNFNVGESDEKLTDRILDLDDLDSEREDEKISENESFDKKKINKNSDKVNDEKNEVVENKMLIFGDKEDVSNLKFFEIMDLSEVKEKSRSLPLIVFKSLFLGAVVYLITNTVKSEFIDARTPKFASAMTMIFSDVFGARTMPLFIGVFVCLFYLILNMMTCSGKRSDGSHN